MLNHDQVWSAIDRFAQRRGLTPSGLARRAGLDATTFNKSKRIALDGRPRWPSTESIAKILAATGARMEEFFQLLAPPEAGRQPARMVPAIGLDRAAEPGRFDAGGFPAGAGWDDIAFPDEGDGTLYALEVSGGSMLPLYRDGDVLVISPSAQVRRGDRVLIMTVRGEVLARTMLRRTARLVESERIEPNAAKESHGLDAIVWIARIVWASQ